MHAAMCEVFVASMVVPALITWLGIWPCMGDLGRVMLVHNVLPRVLRLTYAGTIAGIEASSEFNADEFVGLVDQGAWHRQEENAHSNV